MPPCGVWGVLWALTVALCISQCHSQTWEQLVPKVVHELERLWLQDNGKINIMGNDCVLSVERKKSGRHKSILTCPGWTDVVGRG
nr:uncharacterized protein LOC123751348 isoform X2 [Procambarus clarkii]